METETHQNTTDLENSNGTGTASDMQSMAYKYRHINGWGIDADPENEPTYPMKKYTGDDHKRIHYERPKLQSIDIEVLHSNERPNITATFGTVSPPSGLSGMLRRLAFKYSEESLKHWFTLVLADRVNMVEGVIEDLGRGHVPNIFSEMGWRSDWKYNRKAIVRRVVITTAVTAAVCLLIQRRKMRTA